MDDDNASSEQLKLGQCVSSNNMNTCSTSPNPTVFHPLIVQTASLKHFGSVMRMIQQSFVSLGASFHANLAAYVEDL